MTEETYVEGFGTLPALDLEGGVLAYCGGKRSAQIERRAFRARQRAENRVPLSAKVVHRGGRVDAGPKAKPKIKGKP